MVTIRFKGRYRLCEYGLAQIVSLAAQHCGNVFSRQRKDVTAAELTVGCGLLQKLRSLQVNDLQTFRFNACKGNLGIEDSIGAVLAVGVTVINAVTAKLCKIDVTAVLQRLDSTDIVGE